MEDPAPDGHGSRVLSHTSLADRGDPFRDHLYAREPWVLTPTHQQPNLGRRNKTCRFSRWRAGSHRRSWQRPRQTWMPRNPGFRSLRRRCSSPSEGGSRATRPAPRAAGSGREQKRHMPRAAEPRVLRVRETGSHDQTLRRAAAWLLDGECRSGELGAHTPGRRRCSHAKAEGATSAPLGRSFSSGAGASSRAAGRRVCMGGANPQAPTEE
jgi:hypothetical protein